MYFYDKFQSLCDSRKISVTKAAEDIGLSNATPTKWKNNHTTPNGTTLKRIADYFSVSVSSLICEEDAQKEKPIANNDDELDSGLVKLLCSLSDSEVQLVQAFVEGLIANRKA